MFNLSQSSLTGTKIQFKDTELQKATLFPMFSETGAVKSLLLIDHTRGLLHSSPWVRGMVTKPFFGPLRVNRALASWDLVSRDKGYQLTNLWHFDPWWLLNALPFSNHPASLPLKATNTILEVEGIKELYFARDLSRISLWLSQSGDLQVLEAGFFPMRSRVEIPLDKDYGRVEWRLRPFWESRKRAV